jgi:hypothetical protein
LEHNIWKSSCLNHLMWLVTSSQAENETNVRHCSGCLNDTVNAFNCGHVSCSKSNQHSSFIEFMQELFVLLRKLKVRVGLVLVILACRACCWHNRIHRLRLLLLLSNAMNTITNNIVKPNVLKILKNLMILGESRLGPKNMMDNKVYQVTETIISCPVKHKVVPSFNKELVAGMDEGWTSRKIPRIHIDCCDKCIRQV